MNRVDRLFAIVLLLQQQQLISGQSIAQRFEIGIRTVYRDIAALIESGIPVVTGPGRGYELMSGFTLPPLAFRPDEAVGVFMGMQLLLAHTTGQTAKHTRHALERLTAAMPSETRAYAQVLTNGLRFLAPQQPFDLEQPHLRAVSEAIHRKLVLRLHYQASPPSEATTRDFEPRELSYHQGVWFVLGYCRLRQAERAFRLDRIQTVQALSEHFSPQTEIARDPELIAVQIRVANHDLKRIYERQHYRFSKLELGASHAVLTYQVEQLEEIIPWMLGFGSTTVAIAPPALREAIRLELSAMLEHLT